VVNIKISEPLKEVAPMLKLGIITAQVTVSKHSQSLWNEINHFIEASSLEMGDIAKMSQISEARKAYRALGKDPTRYRLSSDSLLRRIVKGQGLYQVNDIVDLNNLLSMESGHSIGTYDLDTLEGSIEYGIGTADEVYHGIGRGVLNIDGLPVLRDTKGSFGSATSDSERSMITLDTKRILMNIIVFDGDDALSKWMDRAQTLLERHVSGREMKSWIVE
jgi:DNA/RNA-binding domain of Phe-tRNA-synthetase-like protein